MFERFLYDDLLNRREWKLAWTFPLPLALAMKRANEPSRALKRIRNVYSGQIVYVA